MPSLGHEPSLFEIPSATPVVIEPAAPKTLRAAREKERKGMVKTGIKEKAKAEILFNISSLIPYQRGLAPNAKA